MDVIEVMRQLHALYGYDLAALEAARGLLAGVCAAFACRLRKPENASAPAVLDAAAAVCHYQLILRRAPDDGGVTVFKAGDVTVQMNRTAALEAAARTRDEALAAAAPFLTDDDFLFAQVTA